MNGMSNAHFPSDEDLAVATLKVLVDRPKGASTSNKDIQEGVAVLLDLPDEVFTILCSDGQTLEFQRRATWSRTYLKHMRAIENSSRGRWSATDHGRSLSESESSVRRSYRRVRSQPTGTWD